MGKASEFKPMNQAQRKHLMERLRQARTEWSYGSKAIKVPLPAAVQKARAIVSAHDKRVSEISDRHRNAVRAAATKVEQAMLFSTAEEGLAAIERFEKTGK